MYKKKGYKPHNKIEPAVVRQIMVDWVDSGYNLSTKELGKTYCVSSEYVGTILNKCLDLIKNQRRLELMSDREFNQHFVKYIELD